MYTYIFFSYQLEKLTKCACIYCAVVVSIYYWFEHFLLPRLPYYCTVLEKLSGFPAIYLSGSLDKKRPQRQKKILLSLT